MLDNDHIRRFHPSDLQPPPLPPPNVHCINRGDNEKPRWVFRYWSDDKKMYVSEELSMSEFQKEHLHKSLEAMMSAATELPRTRTLLKTWWTDSEHPEGTIDAAETWVRQKNPIEYDQKMERVARVAHAAVTAYLEYLEDDGDPEDIPLLRYVAEPKGIYMVIVDRDEHPESSPTGTQAATETTATDTNLSPPSA